ncbi:hypothetical protein [Mesorhizobium sp.]|uniref:hypothetical protein n=1 Tax=Mesorhizobium sp. TaxID=1871066 RepID=UPI0025C43355|nr:hypothetical protein [Mesorhizobium sp.]
MRDPTNDGYSKAASTGAGSVTSNFRPPRSPSSDPPLSKLAQEPAVGETLERFMAM